MGILWALGGLAVVVVVGLLSLSVKYNREQIVMTPEEETQFELNK